MKKICSSVLFILAFVACAPQLQVGVTVENKSDIDRNNDIIEVDYSQIKSKLGLKDTASVIVYNAENQEVPSQVTYDGKLIFPVTVNSKQAMVYNIKPGKPQGYTVKTFGRQYPERVDDVAWENDRIAFRTYGPALQKTGEKAFGYDVWVKRTEDMILDFRYGQELADSTKSKMKALGAKNPKAANEYYKSISYHHDHGNGLDYYKVGPSLGAGTSAPYVNDSIIFPYCYATYEILDKGPLRFTTKLVYNPMKVGDDSIIETRIISLDAGSQLNKTLISYDNLSNPITVATGLVMHEPSFAFTVEPEKGYMAYDNETDSVNGQTFVGAVFPAQVKEMKAASNHVLTLNEYAPGDVLTYYWGAGWSKWGFETPAQWISYLDNFSQKIKSPLQIKIK